MRTAYFFLLVVFLALPASTQWASAGSEPAPPLQLAQAEPAAKGAAAAEEPGALTAFADVDSSVGDAPHAVQLDVDVISGTGTPPFTYIWDFGDATEFSKEKSPKHTYKIPGNFRASVIVTDSKGEIDQDYFDISVNEANEPGSVTAEQLMEMMPPGELAPELKGMDDQIKDHMKARQDTERKTKN